MSKGIFITFEGGEAVGKTTQIALLRTALEKRGLKVHITREPGGTPLGEKIRNILKAEKMTALAELLLFEASRSELVRSIIIPKLKEGQVILCDRFSESSIVYQGIGRGLGTKLVRLANNIATGGLKSDLVFFLDPGKLEVAQKRLHARGGQDRIELEAQAFHQKVLAGYRQMARADRRFRKYSAAADRLSIHEKILGDVLKVLLKKGLIKNRKKQ